MILFRFIAFVQSKSARPAANVEASFDGYNFWLNKLDAFGGNYQNAEMVKAFLTSIEYRGRFPR